MPTLKHDITSRFTKQKMYAKAHDEVKIISRSDHVLIVEGPDGFRFSIVDSDLTERLPDAVDPPAYVPPPPPPPVETLFQPPSQKKTPKRSSTKPQDQRSLF